MAFRACLVMVQLRHENGFPVFQVYGYGTENIPLDPDAAVAEDVCLKVILPLLCFVMY